MLSLQEIRQLGTKDMMEELQKARRDLLKIQFDVRNGTSKEVHMVKNLKRYIARLQTVAKELKVELKPVGMGKGEAAPVEKTTAEKEERKSSAKKSETKAGAPKKAITQKEVAKSGMKPATKKTKPAVKK